MSNKNSAAKLGGNGIRVEGDFYSTPADVTRALLAFEKFTGMIYEPAAGTGAILAELIAAGYLAVGTDIVPCDGISQCNFFNVTESPAPNIITNPPFEQADLFIRHAVGLPGVRKVAMLLKADYWCAAGRMHLFRCFMPTRILPLTWRPDFRNFGGSMLNVAWNVWEIGMNGIPTYCPLEKPCS